MKKVCFILCLSVFSFAFGSRLSSQNMAGPYVGNLYGSGNQGSVSESSESFADNNIKWKRRHKKRKKARRPQRGR